MRSTANEKFPILLGNAEETDHCWQVLRRSTAYVKQDVFSLKCLQMELCEVLMSPESTFVGAEEYKIENEKKNIDCVVLE